MKDFQVQFVGRKAGAIGVRYTITQSVAAESRKDALAALYNDYQDIHIVSWLRFASFNRFELLLTEEQADSASHQGRCDEDVEVLVKEIREQLEALDPEALAAELSEYGAWDDEELEDVEANFQRIAWLAACNIKEEGIDPMRCNG